MSDSKQVSAEDLAEITQIQQEYNDLATRYGDLHFQKLLLDAAIQEVTEAYIQLEQRRNLLVEKVEKTYGIGRINLETGHFVPEKNLENS